jgi:RNA polymerase sigma-70 factor (ECF subfamily)
MKGSPHRGSPLPSSENPQKGYLQLTMVEPRTTPHNPAHEERTLRVRQAQEGNAEAFNTLVSESTSAVFGICWAYLQQIEVAEELTQEVFLRAWLKLPELRQPERFPAWIAQMARNEARTWNRTNTSRSKLVQLVPLESESQPLADESQKSAFTTMQNTEEAALLNQALAKLTPEEREMIHLHYSESLSQRQIAERLEVNHSTVSRQLQRALGTLRSLLGQRDTPTALPTPLATPQLKSKITALVLASVATPGVLPKLRAEAALLPSSPAATLASATPLFTSIGTTISALGTGITIMTLTQKLTAVAAITLTRLSHQLRRETAKRPSGQGFPDASRTPACIHTSRSTSKGYPWNGGMI